MNYQFQYPQAFYLLALLPLLVLIFFAYRYRQARSVKKIGDPPLVTALYRNHSSSKTIFKFILLSLAFALGCIILANPRIPESSGEVRKGIDVVVALDVSNSMLATDIAPDRLTRAKQFISKFIDRLQDDRTSLVVFAGNGYIRTPLTFDKGATRMFVSVASPGSIREQGTNISDALDKAEFVFGDQDERFRTVILITDGETHDDNAVATAKRLAERGIMVNTVGIGSEEGSTLTDSTGNVKENEGQVVVSRLNEEILKQLAASTNGVYVRLNGVDDAVTTISSQFSDIDKKALGDTANFIYHPLYAWLAVPMLLLMLLEIFIPDRKKIRV